MIIAENKKVTPHRSRAAHAHIRVALIAAILTPLFACGDARRSDGSSAHSESDYHRVIQTGKIRAAYIPYPPGCVRDANTGELKGVFVETLEAASSALGLELEWAEEVGWGTMIEGLKTDRYEIVGSPVWANASRARQADFTTPLYYSGIGVYVRSDDGRGVDGLGWINSADVTVATIDGEMSQIIADQDFPRASLNSLPQLTDNAQLLLNVKEGKADVTFVEPYIANLFLKSHPGSLKNLVPGRPIRIFPNTVMVDKGEDALRRMLDTALAEQVNSGLVDGLLETYDPTGGSFYKVAHPYRVDG